MGFAPLPSLEIAGSPKFTYSLVKKSTFVSVYFLYFFLLAIEKAHMNVKNISGEDTEGIRDISRLLITPLANPLNHVPRPHEANYRLLVHFVITLKAPLAFT